MSKFLGRSLRTASILLAMALSAGTPLRTAMAADAGNHLRSSAWGSRFHSASATNGGNSAASRAGRGILQIVGLPFQVVRTITSAIFQTAQIAMKKGADGN